MGRLPAAAYDRYIKSERWKLMRRSRIQMTNDAHPPLLEGFVRCNHCERFVWSGGIDVHHRTYERLGFERLSDLAVLCRGCHAIEHGKEPPYWWQEAKRQGLSYVSSSFAGRHRPESGVKAAGEIACECLEVHDIAAEAPHD